MRQSAFVPHDLRVPLHGAGTGPLAGLTAAVKDMYDIAGERTGGGNPTWLAAQEPARTTAAALRRLLDAGADIIGKTVCDEFFFSLTGDNVHYGTPLNTRAPARLPGGSSSGSAAAVGAGACDIALGSDTGGSVRVPAALNGIYGMRPTHGRVSLEGAMAMAPNFDTAGWFAAGPGLLRKAGHVLLEGQSDKTPIQWVRMAEDAFALADAAVRASLHDFLTRAAELRKPRSPCARKSPDQGLVFFVRSTPRRFAKFPILGWCGMRRARNRSRAAQRPPRRVLEECQRRA